MDRASEHEEKRSHDERMQTCPLCSSERIQPYDVDFRGMVIDRCACCGVKFMASSRDTQGCGGR